MDIKSIRKLTNLSQRQFANLYNIPLRTLQKWEQHDSEPSPYLLSMIEDKALANQFIDVDKYKIKTKGTKFKVVIEEQYLNVDKIHPIQQHNIYRIIENLKNNSNVISITVFGSSVTPFCNYDSDIDLYVELKKDENVKTYNVDVPVDYWNNFTVDTIIKNEIISKGVKVYAR